MAKKDVMLVVVLGVLLYANLVMVGVWTTCPAGNCSRLGGTVPKSNLFILSVQLLQGGIPK